jgi:(p)ppGpp synthase/HD superfamily hydrolase
MFSTKFQEAFRFAAEAHGKQKRKGTETPYIAHPMAVASLVIEHGGGEAVAIAALLHDVVEDTKVTAAEVEAAFGPEVLELVLAVTNPPIDWKTFESDSELQKALSKFRADYRAKLRTKSTDVQLLSACDKLHNARGILEDLRRARDDAGEGKKAEEVAQLVMAVWNRFRGKRTGTAEYYAQLASVYSESESAQVRQLGRSLRAVTDAMAAEF